VSHHIVFTVSGTGTNMTDTTTPQPALVGSNLAAADPDLFLWQPVGDYPAATFPMGPSVLDGINSLIYMTTGDPVPGSNTTVPGPTYPENSIILLGYSQGAIVVCAFVQWCFANNRQDILERLVAVGVWGNPCRLPGFASGNEFAGWPLPGTVDGYITGGISGPGTTNLPAGAGVMTLEQVQPQLATEVTHYWGDFVNTIGDGNDLYADCPTGPSPVTLDGEAIPGSAETLIYEIIQGIGTEDLPELELQLTRLFGTEPLPELLGITEAIINGGLFLIRGANAAHYTYDTTPIQSFIALAGSQTAPWGPA
jgi:hypothetical protein